MKTNKKAREIEEEIEQEAKEEDELIEENEAEEGEEEAAKELMDVRDYIGQSYCLCVGTNCRVRKLYNLSYTI